LAKITGTLLIDIDTLPSSRSAYVKTAVKCLHNAYTKKHLQCRFDVDIKVSIAHNGFIVLIFYDFMAVLKTDVKRITLTMPKQFLSELDCHVNNFALTDRSRWLIEAAKEKMAKEKEILSEIDLNE